MMHHEHEYGHITYSRGQWHGETQPEVHGPELWHVHFWYSDDRRDTWDISNGAVIAVSEQTWRKTRNHWGWWSRDLPRDTPLPIAITEEADHA